MRLLLVVSQNSYLFRDLFLRIIEEAERRGLELALIISAKAQWEMSDAITRNLTVFHYGSALNELEKQTITSRFKFHYSTVQALFKLKSEVKRHLKSFNPDVVLTPDSYDPVLQAIHKTNATIPVYYIQHSNIINRHVGANRRSKLQNRLTRLFSGIQLNDELNRPPFSYEYIRYLLWSPRWLNDVDLKKYAVSYVSKVTRNERHSFIQAKSGTLNILVILNKRGFIGNENWLRFAEFYNEMFGSTEHRICFKAHPKDDLHYAKNIFKDFEVVSDSVDLAAFDMVVGHWSSFVYEAALNGKPYIMVNPAGQFDYTRFKLADYPLMVKEPKDIQTYITGIELQQYDIDELNTNFLKDHLGSDFSPSAEKIFETIQISK